MPRLEVNCLASSTLSLPAYARMSTLLSVHERIEKQHQKQIKHSLYFFTQTWKRVAAGDLRLPAFNTWHFVRVTYAMTSAKRDILYITGLADTLRSN